MMIAIPHVVTRLPLADVLATAVGALVIMILAALVPRSTRRTPPQEIQAIGAIWATLPVLPVIRGPMGNACRISRSGSGPVANPFGCNVLAAPLQG